MASPSIPDRCTVLVIGAGPGGSYAASALAREGIEVVQLEADTFPRYHIGESMLASMRHLLRFIDLEDKFESYGFIKKPGAAFKLNKHKREGLLTPIVDTDFIAAGGPNNYAWNVVRSEADLLMFRHAGDSGVKTFDGVKVQSIEFLDATKAAEGEPNLNPGRPVAATYQVKSTKESGRIIFDYVVDASGRAGILSTQYMKNRRFNQGLKNVASWGYWEKCGTYSPGTYRENSPFFEALRDQSGWAWFIPLHNKTVSVGVVMNQEIAIQRKKEGQLDTTSHYHESLKLAPALGQLIGDGGKLTSNVKAASDYSYSASAYAFPYARIVGDAGCFIDPYFSSGVHLALTGGLAAATTIAAAIRGDCDETTAADWHSKKIADAYTRFLLVVLSAYQQIRNQEEPVLSDFDEDNFDRAFSFFRPIIQGTADQAAGKLTQSELNKTLEFCANAFKPVASDEACAQAVEKLNSSGDNGASLDRSGLTQDQIDALDHVRARKMMRTEDTMNIDSFGTDAIGNLAPRLVRGSLGLSRQHDENGANGGHAGAAVNGA
ncbi:FAD/NAD(P)-binding domain-containing protein [Apiospora kogelbergensis]|uniref:FAD/NAD(P)-binding domain-containing protein n=1 Tax=Apiospora kogelbergensis TaxID=1337665 RepID=UPI003131DFD9